MQPADDIKKLIDESRITSSRQVDRRILADALEDLKKRVPCLRSRKHVVQEHVYASIDMAPRAWRIVMNSKWSKLAVAAVIVVAVLLGLQFVGGSSVTFAQAIQPILNASSAVFDIIVGAEEPNSPVIRDMVVGSRIRRTVSNIPGNVSIIDLESKRILTLTEAKKEAAYIDLKGLPAIPNYLELLKNTIVRLQDSPHFEVEDLGTRQIDGREAVGFLAKHPSVEIIVWADSKTGLPVRIESKEGQLNVICRNVQFDVPMDESLFSMEVPEGYKLQQMELDLNSATEEDFVAGLRLLAEKVNDGYFPDGVAVEDFLKQVPAITKKTEAMKLSSEEELELGKKIQQYLLFTRFFKGEGRWYYRGKGIKLGEADKAIFWYRPKGSKTYRVIYGDLRVEDVAPGNLPEPLSADDVVKPAVSYTQWSKPEFVGSQEDFWYVLPDGKVQVKAYLTLMKGPKDVSLMPVRLPYAKAPLEAVLLGGPGRPAQDFAALAFHKTDEGLHNIELPIDKLLAGQTMMIFQWHLSLDELKAGDIYRTVLQSLIPVISYKLNVGVDPQSGFELTKPPTNTWVTPFTGRARDGATTEFGTCGLLIRKRP
jgi:hypothetical protein